MDIISNRKISKNILQWYPMDKNSNVLQIGYIEAEIIEELCNKTKNVTIIVETEEQKQKIIKKIKNNNL